MHAFKTVVLTFMPLRPPRTTFRPLDRLLFPRLCASDTTEDEIDDRNHTNSMRKSDFFYFGIAICISSTSISQC